MAIESLAHDGRLLGSLIAVVAGTINGIFAIPMRLSGRWHWENYWLVFSALSLGLLPWVTSFLRVPCLAEALTQIQPGDAAMCIVSGAIVYFGSLLFGIALTRIGTALAFSLLVGTMSVVGTLIPIALFHLDSLTIRSLGLLSAAATLFVVGMAANVRAGRLRQTIQFDGENRAVGPKPGGMKLAILGGALAGLLSLGLEMPWAHSINAVTQTIGRAQPSDSNILALALMLTGGTLPNCGFAWLKLRKNNSLVHYRTQGQSRPILIVVVMSLMYYGSVLLWGVSVSPVFLGGLGPSIGWALFIGSMVISSSFAGVIVGEWRGSERVYPTLGWALLCTAVAVFLTSAAQFFMTVRT